MVFSVLHLPTSFPIYFDIGARGGRHFEGMTEIASAADVSTGIEIAYRQRTSGESRKTALFGISSVKMMAFSEFCFRYNSGDVTGSVTFLETTNRSAASWLSQANYIFRQLKIVSNYEDYGFVHTVHFILELSSPTQKVPEGYLFVSSPSHFRTGATSFRWPARSAYWSLDPSDRKPLSDEEASSLGFPSITLKTRVSMTYWNEGVYAAQRKFHAGKGFDPDTQDVARDLGYPLYEGSAAVLDGQYEPWNS
ncbi:hypothetical protein C8R45DRAFT_932239 [Mycena sanguinolenta]|nr:hypothetical protein C8R45DRAFT_932239 [Mycena sanguinolenta]